jgi:hypothetical protein
VESVSCWDLRVEIALERAYENHGVEILDADTKWEIQQDLWDEYVRRYPDHYHVKLNIPEVIFNIPRYYGTYHGYVVIDPYGYYNSQIDPLVSEEIIDGIRFQGQVSMLYEGIIVWKDGSISTMTELYELGILTREDLLTIKDTQKRVWEAEYEAFQNM